MAHPYAPEYPSSTAVDPHMAQFFENFYRTTDINTPEAHEQYVDNFTNDAVFVMASQSARGRDEIMAAREGMWKNVARRRHMPAKVFPFGPGASELMLYGTVAYELHDGRKTVIDWAAQAQLVKEEGRWKFARYQVYLDPTAWQNAK